MGRSSHFKAVYITPQKQFRSFAELVEVAGVVPAADLQPRFFDLPRVAIIVDREHLPIWQPTLFLADCALRSRSVLGDTVRSYAEALLRWLQFLTDRRSELCDVTEELLATYRNELVHR